jgi:hypothetical protein
MKARLKREADALNILKEERAMRAQFETELGRLETEKQELQGKNRGFSLANGGSSRDPLAANPSGPSHPVWDVEVNDAFFRCKFVYFYPSFWLMDSHVFSFLL